MIIRYNNNLENRGRGKEEVTVLKNPKFQLTVKLDRLFEIKTQKISLKSKILCCLS